jgi:pectin methylesterase-like acyl-CoA thioesterase
MARTYIIHGRQGPQGPPWEIPANTIIVGKTNGDYDSIQEAIDAAVSDGSAAIETTATSSSR